MKVEHKYRVRDNLELEYYLQAKDPRKRFFIHEILDFDENVLKPRLPLPSLSDHGHGKNEKDKEDKGISQGFWSKMA